MHSRMHLPPSVIVTSEQREFVEQFSRTRCHGALDQWQGKSRVWTFGGLAAEPEEGALSNKCLKTTSVGDPGDQAHSSIVLAIVVWNQLFDGSRSCNRVI